MKAKIGTKLPAIDENIFHRTYVKDRIKDIELKKLESHLWVANEQILPINYRGTHPLWEHPTLWSYFKRIISELRP
jgi:hypothetical protein